MKKGKKRKSRIRPISDYRKKKKYVQMNKLNLDILSSLGEGGSAQGERRARTLTGQDELRISQRFFRVWGIPNLGKGPRMARGLATAFRSLAKET